MLRGGLTTTPEQVDVAALVQALTTDLADQLDPHPIQVDAPGPAIASVDRGKVSQAVTNLLSNAPIGWSHAP